MKIARTGYFRVSSCSNRLVLASNIVRILRTATIGAYSFALAL